MIYNPENVAAVRRFLIHEAVGQLQTGGFSTSLAIQNAAAAALLGADVGDLCAALRILEEPVREQMVILSG